MSTKVIHVHMIATKKNYYFGSISAIFSVLTEDDLGCSESYLHRLGLKDGNKHLTGRALIVCSHLIRGGSGNK